jgi:hypothetical protein
MVLLNIDDFYYILSSNGVLIQIKYLQRLAAARVPLGTALSLAHSVAPLGANYGCAKNMS